MASREANIEIYIDENGDLVWSEDLFTGWTYKEDE